MEYEDYRLQWTSGSGLEFELALPDDVSRKIVDRHLQFEVMAVAQETMDDSFDFMATQAAVCRYVRGFGE